MRYLRITRTKALAIAGNVLLALASLVTQHYFTRPDQEWMWRTLLGAFLVGLLGSAIGVFWPYIEKWRDERMVDGAAALLDIGTIERPKPPTQGRPRRLHRTPVEEIAFWQDAKNVWDLHSPAGKRH